MLEQVVRAVRYALAERQLPAVDTREHRRRENMFIPERVRVSIAGRALRFLFACFAAAALEENALVWAKSPSMILGQADSEENPQEDWNSEG